MQNNPRIDREIRDTLENFERLMRHK